MTPPTALNIENSFFLKRCCIVSICKSSASEQFGVNFLHEAVSEASGLMKSLLDFLPGSSKGHPLMIILVLSGSPQV